jgi:hypothetical protein
VTDRARRGTALASADDRSEEVVGILLEIPSFEEGSNTLLRAARVEAAVTMLRRSGFDLVLLPVGAAFQMEKRRRRRWWRRPG